jgi:hypothetical protein
MPWACGECNAREDRQVRIDGVCHHCGKLLCRADQKLVVDFVFADEDGPLGREAVHCRSCAHEHHPTDLHLSRKSR